MFQLLSRLNIADCPSVTGKKKKKKQHHLGQSAKLAVSKLIHRD